MSAEVKDTDGETLLSKGLDLSYFTGGWGKIKYEHEDNLAHFIGAPTRVFKKGTELHFEGELYPFDGIPDDKLTAQQKTAKDAFGLLQSTDEWNRTHPNNQQKVGWSIEGAYLDQDKKTGIVRKARITNVVLTTKPVNTATFATLIKSLSVGYGTTPDTQTGFGATRKESIENTTKFQTNQEHTKMYKSKEECYKAMLAQGKSEEEAKELANKWEREQGGAKEPAGDEMQKSLKSFADAQESINNLTAIQPAFSIESFETEFKKSVQTSDNEIDITKYFEIKKEADLSLLDSQLALNQKVDLLAKALSSLITGVTPMLKSVATTEQFSRLNGKALNVILKSKSTSGMIPSELIQKTEVVDNIDNTENADFTKLNKSQKSDILFQLYEEGKVNSSVVTKAEMGHIDEGTEQLIKANINKLRK